MNTEEESIIKFLYGSSSYKGYWYGDTPPGKPSFWWRNLLREEIQAKDAEHKQQLKQRDQTIEQLKEVLKELLSISRWYAEEYPIDADRIGANPGIDNANKLIDL